ncbi:MAG: hypothetical protein HZB22_00275 [Deltaproteobacteria bacterium]|nr:hypothetical protein [Deltaproteobacteria bacterium]
MDKRLNIVFIWHMHQPLYKDPISNEYTMPWVLLHGTKDYYDMVSILDEFPDVHQTFNLVPCLMEQFMEYGSGEASDTYRKISAKPAPALTNEEKGFILQNFFQANWDNMIKPLPRYWELLTKRGQVNSKEDIASALRYFVEQDYLDLQVLFNLVWIDPVIRRGDAFLSALYKKGRGYTEKEKARLLDKQIEIINRILPKYAEMRDKGIIEISTTPYYHPILPLLCDSFSAREAVPDMTLPRERFTHPEDAQAQIERGAALYREVFKQDPVGMWPSEGSVSMDMLPLAARAGFKWLATDEEILTNSLKRGLHRDAFGNCYDSFLYRPYAMDAGGKSLTILFRDHVLSDLIGFDYARMDPEDAANDFMGRLYHIHGMLPDPENHVVSVILDGENAWEGFRNDGRDFLVSLYSKLSNNSRLRCVTVSEFLASTTHREHLKWLYPGSWIGHNFKIWIGHVEDNTAWNYIIGAREALVNYQESIALTPEYESRKKEIGRAWDAIYAAEGSDWFWWYGEEHSTMCDEHFDSLFRKQVKMVYNIIGLEAPDYIDIPISSESRGYRPPVEPSAYISPVLDGEITNYFEWLSSGRIERQYYGSAMHREVQGGGLIEGISYGFSRDTLYLRFDYLEGIYPYMEEWGFTITALQPKPVRISATIAGKSARASLFEKASAQERWSDTGMDLRIASDSVVELAVPFETLGARSGDEIRLYVAIDAGTRGVERWPVKGFLLLNTPTEDFEELNWIV